MLSQIECKEPASRSFFTGDVDEWHLVLGKLFRINFQASLSQQRFLFAAGLTSSEEASVAQMV
ncbi:MAG: hypothetical protein KDA63_19275, partial [Planctomycetales bacterium]|nr:hypothetical protein [Planctomycetales bacterium]